MPLSRINAQSLTDGSIVTAEIADNAISTAKLADDSVTGAKIENNPTIAGNLTVSGTSTFTGNATASGTLGVTGNTTVGGTLVNTGLITASGGISIGSGGSSNVIDDYVEGTFTPTLEDPDGSGAVSTYYYRAGKYTKIGILFLLR